MIVGIIIVNWNSGRQLLECLDSIDKYFIECSLFEIVVVDNASIDQSIALIEEREFRFKLRIIQSLENLGFAKACNLGALQCAHVEYLLFLNPDTRLLDSLAIESAVNFLKSNPKYGICGVQLIDEQGQISKTCARFPGFLNLLYDAIGLSKLFPNYFLSKHMVDWDHASSREVDHVIGAFYLIKTTIFSELNGFDERFFVYLEDLDLSYRAALQGYKSYYCTEVRVFHKGGGTSSQVKDRRLFYSIKSTLLYIAKHFPWYQSLCLFFIILLIEPLTRLLFCLLRRDFKGAINTIMAYKMVYCNLANIMKLSAAP